MFVFISGNLSAEDTAQLVIKVRPKIYRHAQETKRPALFSIREDGTIVHLRL
jgi:hypothetical protein